MKRKAILIESSKVKNHTYLAGAIKDVKNWKAFLTSDLGGGWKDEEVIILSHPYLWEVTNAALVSPDCYCFVVFSGHGCDGAVVLSDSNQKVKITDLYPTGQRGTVLIDACRGEDQDITRIVTLANESLSARAEGSYERIKALFQAAAVTQKLRSEWEKAFGSPVGILRMNSCAKGQDANEDPESGGFYTSLLINSALQWEFEHTERKIYSTKDAHNSAALKMPPQQTPEYIPAFLTYPFAVKQ
jgi:hypothetical protein